MELLHVVALLWCAVATVQADTLSDLIDQRLDQRLARQRLDARLARQENGEAGESVIQGVLAELGLTALLPSFRKRAIVDREALELLSHDTMAQYMPEVALGDRLKILDFIAKNKRERERETTSDRPQQCEPDRRQIAAVLTDVLVSHGEQRSRQGDTAALVAGLIEENNEKLLARVAEMIAESHHKPATAAGAAVTSAQEPERRRLESSASSLLDNGGLWLEDDDSKVVIGGAGDTDLYRASAGVVGTSGGFQLGTLATTCDADATGTLRFSAEKAMLQVCAKEKWNSAGASVFDEDENEPCNDDTAGAFQWDKTDQIHSRCANGAAEWKRSIKMGADSATCSTANAGTIRFQNGAFDACDGVLWWTVLGQPTMQPTESPTVEALGTENKPADSCMAIKTWAGGLRDTPSGFYWISLLPNGPEKVKVYCEMWEKGGGWMLAAKMKDPQSGWADASSAAGQKSNFVNYSPGWGDYNSNWWTTTTGATEPTSGTVSDNNGGDFKSDIFNYYATSGGVDKVCYTNGKSLDVREKRQGIRHNIAEYGSLRQMFATMGQNEGSPSRSDSDGSEGEYWRITASGGTDDHDTGVINRYWGNWVPGRCRICSGMCQDACKYGGTIFVGAGFTWWHGGGNDVGGGPASAYGLHSSYEQGKAMWLWIK